MDPVAALRRVMQALLDKNAREACEGLFAYYHWRVKGGFEPRQNLPQNGDTLAETLAARVLDMMEDQHG